MSNKLSKSEAAKIIGVHEKTLERYIKENLNSIADPAQTGFAKNKMNGRVEFDASLFRQWAGALGAEVERTGADPEHVIDADPESEGNTGLVVGVKRSDAAGAVQAMITAMAIQSENAKLAALLPYKDALTLSEARALTGLPLWFLKENRGRVRGRVYIFKSDLPGLVKKFRRTPATVPATKKRRVKK